MLAQVAVVVRIAARVRTLVKVQASMSRCAASGAYHEGWVCMGGDGGVMVGGSPDLPPTSLSDVAPPASCAVWPSWAASTGCVALALPIEVVRKRRERVPIF